MGGPYGGLGQRIFGDIGAARRVRISTETPGGHEKSGWS
jgi:hypothetical protein